MKPANDALVGLGKGGYVLRLLPGGAIPPE